MMRLLHVILFASVLILAGNCGPKADQGARSGSTDAATPNVVRIYTHRYYTTDKQIFDQFTANTGIKVEVVKDTDQKLLARMQAEADKPQADIFIASDVIYLEEARKAGLLQPFSSPILDRNLPTRYRDNTGHWAALDRGAVGLAFAKGKVDLSTLYVYNDITSPVWRGKILLGDPRKASNRGLVAGLIAVNGEAATAKWLQGLVQNSVPGFSAASDFDLIKALAAGQGNMALVPSSTLLQMMAGGNPDYAKPAESVGFIFLSFADRTTVFYISGAGLIKDAPHRDLAVLLLEFLTSEQQQTAFTSATIDYPVNPMTLPHEFIDNIGGFYEIKKSLNEVAELYPAADRLMQAAGWRSPAQ